MLLNKNFCITYCLASITCVLVGVGNISVLALVAEVLVRLRLVGAHRTSLTGDSITVSRGSYRNCLWSGCSLGGRCVVAASSAPCREILLTLKHLMSGVIRDIGVVISRALKGQGIHLWIDTLIIWRSWHYNTIQSNKTTRSKASTQLLGSIWFLKISREDSLVHSFLL